jgi:AraC-like DNA-binding protein
LNNVHGPIFWRDDALPFIEARSIRAARDICYARHSHETFSIGAICAGRCSYVNRTRREQIGSGSVVLMNPGDVHACNPLRNEAWTYRMLYFDTAWVRQVQQEITNRGGADFQPFSATSTRNPRLYHALNRLYDVLSDPQADHLQKHGTALNFMIDVQRTLSPVSGAMPNRGNSGLGRAAEFIHDNCTRSLKLEEICSAANLSASYLIRAFKAEYGMSPHTYLINCRIEFSRQQLRRGRALAEVALAAGFSDQAHLQRTFKKFVAATPGQYRANVFRVGA